MNKQMNKKKNSHTGDLLSYQAKAALRKYTEVSEKRNTLQKQVKMLQAVLRANKSPHHLRAVIEAVVSGGSSVDDVLHDEPVQEKFVPPRFVSHEDKKMEDLVGQIRKKVRDEVVTGKQGSILIEQMRDAGKLSSPAAELKANAAEKEFEEQDAKEKASEAVAENAALKKKLAAMQEKLQSVELAKATADYESKDDDNHQVVQKVDFKKAADETATMEKEEENEQEEKEKEEDEDRKNEKNMVPSSDENKPSSDENKPSSDENKPSSDENKPSSDENKTTDKKKEEGKETGKTHKKSHIQRVLKAFRASKAKLAAARAEVLTLRARKAEMKKENIKGELKKGGGKEENLRDSYEASGVGLRNPAFGKIQVKLAGPGQFGADLGESSGIQDRSEAHIADHLSTLNRMLRLRERQYRSIKHDVARRHEEITGMMA